MAPSPTSQGSVETAGVPSLTSLESEAFAHLVDDLDYAPYVEEAKLGGVGEATEAVVVEVVEVAMEGDKLGVVEVAMVEGTRRNIS